MIQVLAKQLIYTRVEETYSPVHKSGYQIYYSSPGLKQNIIDLIARKVSEFQPHLPTLKRWQCFFLENDSIVVITQTQLIDSDPEIIDKSSRPGVLVAHCLILDKGDYKLIGCEPFGIIEQFKFVKTAKEMIERYNQNDGKELQATFKRPEYIDYEINPSWKDNIYQLALTAAPQFVKGKNSILFYGEDSEIFETLKVLFLCIPSSYRENLTFDTYIRGRQVPAGEFWAVGLPEWKNGYGLAINTSTNSFSSIPNKFDDFYLQWLYKTGSEKLNLGTVFAVQEISDSFHYKKAINEDQIGNEALESFFEVHQQVILTRVLTISGQVLGKNLSLLFEKFLEQNSPLFDLISIAATGLFPLNKLSLRIREWIVSHELDFRLIAPDDWVALKQVSVNAKDNILMLWCASFTTDKKLFQNAIKTLSADEYSFALKLMTQPLQPLSLLVLTYISQFVSALAENLDRVGEEEYVEIINEIMVGKGYKEMDRIADFVFRLGNKELTHLEKLTVKQPIPSHFRSSIEKRRSQLGQQYTVIDAILRRK